MRPSLKFKAKRFLARFVKSGLTNKRIVVFASNVEYCIHPFNVLLKTKKTDLFDYECPLKKNYFFCNELYKGNVLYGISRAIRSYAHYDKKIFACIEHGVYFGKAQIAIETYESGLPALICFAPERKKHLREITNKPIITIGPYILYSKSYLTSDEIQQYKTRFGKTLLFFPSHSGEGIQAIYDSKELIIGIEGFKRTHGFETVIICLYYSDIELKRDIEYKEAGYIISTGGRREDPDFLPRLRALIEISDYTASNDVGTHIGYCISLNKPHTIITKERIEYSGELKSQAGIDEVSVENTNIVWSYFSEHHPEITAEQRMIVNRYWGLEEHKTPEELYDLLKKCETTFKKAKSREELFYQVALNEFGEGSSEMI